MRYAKKGFLGAQPENNFARQKNKCEISHFRTKKFLKHKVLSNFP